MESLSGESFSAAWNDAEGHILLTASLPVQNLKNVLGAVMLLRSGGGIESAVRSVQLTVLQLFLWALLATIILSFYLSETIGSPILRLADAAERVRQSLLLKDSIPNFSYRRDEIGILSIALREMTTALADRMDAIGNFAADVAHEIKNPLASLKSAVETFAVVKDPERQKKLLAIIESDVDRLNRLITDISMVSRLDSEMNRAEKELLDMTRLLQNIVDLESSSSGIQERVSLELDKNKKLWVRGNDTQLAQVMHNLIQNAISFVSDQGRIAITALAQEDKVVIYVDNDGPAIPEKKLETIFQRFYSERPEKEKFGLHSGLGLNISRQIIRAHQGTIFARNLKTPKGEHQGVRFTIILPAGGAT
jgi:two-component system sensor histidine kinase ChvG